MQPVGAVGHPWAGLPPTSTAGPVRPLAAEGSEREQAEIAFEAAEAENGGDSVTAALKESFASGILTPHQVEMLAAYELMVAATHVGSELKLSDPSTAKQRKQRATYIFSALDKDNDGQPRPQATRHVARAHAGEMVTHWWHHRRRPSAAQLSPAWLRGMLHCAPSGGPV